MQARRRRGIPLPVAGQVTSLELFFDLVFVFTITQLTASVLPGGWAATGRTALLLLLLWWMYGGYAWLTNAAPPVTLRRQMLLVMGMTGLFVTAMAIPHAYGTDRVVFACGYRLVVVGHAGMYVSEATRLTRGMVVQLLGWNMAGALLGLVGALFFESILAWWWLASFLVAVVLPRLFGVTALKRPEVDQGPTFDLVPAHFVERHGLMLLIALGESVLAIGAGLGTGVESIGVERIGFAVVSLLLATTLYWAYFGVGEDARAEAALEELAPGRAQDAALASYGYAFWVVLLGVVLSAAGLHHALAHPTDRLSWAYAGQLSVGAGLFWAGLGLFRLALGLPGALLRLIGGLGLSAVVVVGATVSGLLALLCLSLGSAALVMVDHRATAHAARPA